MVCTGCIGVRLGSVSEVSKCYQVAGEQCCFYTAGSFMSWDEARQYSEEKNSTLPIIRDEGIDRVFQQFVANDSSSLIQNSSVWLGAYARPNNESVKWHWINGKPSGMYAYSPPPASYSFIRQMLRSVADPRGCPGCPDTRPFD